MAFFSKKAIDSKKMRSPFHSLGLGFLSLLLPRLFFLWSYSQTPYFYCFPEGLDSTRFDQFAQQIVAGDVLFQEGIYPQSPLYSYFLAFCYLLFGIEYRFWTVRWIQMLIGIGTGILLFRSTARLWNSRVAYLALIGYALCPIFPFYEVQFLRVSLSLFLTMLCFESWSQWRISPSPTAGVLLGASSGLLFLQEPHHLLIIPFLLCQRGLPWKKLCFFPLASFFLLLVPLMLRNYFIEVPILSVSAQGADVFIAGHAPDALGIGWFVPPSATELKKSGGLLSVASQTLKANHGNWLAYFQLQQRKLMALCADFEIPNNFHFSFDRRAYFSWISLPFPTFGFFFGFGVAGILLMILQEKRFQPLGGFMIGSVFAVMSFYLLSRFRVLCYLPLLMGTAYLFDSLRFSPRARYFWGVGFLFMLLSYSYTPPDPREAYGAYNLANAYLIQAERQPVEAQYGSLSRALFWLEEALQKVKSEYELAPEWYQKLVQMRPIRPAYWRKASEIYVELGYWRKAEALLKELESAFQYAPKKEIAYALIGVNQKFYEKKPHFSYLFNQAMLFYYLQNVPEARKLLLQSLKLHPPENVQQLILSKLAE